MYIYIYVCVCNYIYIYAIIIIYIHTYIKYYDHYHYCWFYCYCCSIYAKNTTETYLEPHSPPAFASTSRFPNASASAFGCPPKTWIKISGIIMIILGNVTMMVTMMMMMMRHHLSAWPGGSGLKVHWPRHARYVSVYVSFPFDMRGIHF